MSSAEDLILVTSEGQRVGPVTVRGVDVDFPSPEVRWTWVLDARIVPYTDLPLATVLERARNVRKKWVIVPASQLDAHLAKVNQPRG